MSATSRLTRLEKRYGEWLMRNLPNLSDEELEAITGVNMAMIFDEELDRFISGEWMPSETELERITSERRHWLDIAVERGAIGREEAAEGRITPRIARVLLELIGED